MLVLPGEYVGTSEEYSPAHGVYSEQDKLYAAGIGELKLDAASHTAGLVSKTRIMKPQGVGTITLGIVAEASDSVAIVDLIPFRSRNFEFVVSGLSAVLRVANIDRKYVKSLRDEIRIGDIVRVKVMEVTSHTIRLTTAERDLGVIKAFCSSCRHDLEKQGTKLVCRNCGSVESRKTASDYGSGKLI